MMHNSDDGLLTLGITLGFIMGAFLTFLTFSSIDSSKANKFCEEQGYEFESGWYLKDTVKCKKVMKMNEDNQ